MRNIVVLCFLLFISGIYAFDWEWENNFGLPASAFAGENAIQAVGDTLYAVCLVGEPGYNNERELYFCKSSNGNSENLNLNYYFQGATGEPSLAINLPEITILIKYSWGTAKLVSLDYGNTWMWADHHYQEDSIIDSNDPMPIIRHEAGSTRSFTVNAVADSTDVMYYTQQSKSVHGNNVYYYGPDVIDGAIKVAGDIYIKQAGGGTNCGWPTFLDPVIISGHVISSPASYPVEMVFQGGLTELADLDASLIQAKLFKRSFKESASVIDLSPDEDTILLLEVDGNTASGYWGVVTEPRRAYAHVWDPYPPLLVAEADSLFMNNFLVRDTLWTQIEPFTLPDKLYTDATLWIKGSFCGVKSIYSSEIIYTIGDILLESTPPGEDPSANMTDKVTLITDKKILVKYGYKDPGDNLRYHPNCRADSEPILIYADLIAMRDLITYDEDTAAFDAGEFSFEYQHPHGSTPAVEVSFEGSLYYYDWMDLHRYRFPPTDNQPWPANIDYPWYNPLWPERMPYTERGTIKHYGAIYQNRRGMLHRSGNDSEYPSNAGIWDIAFDMCGGPVTLMPMPDPVIGDLVLQCRRYPGTSGSGIGYKKGSWADSRDFPDLPRKEIWSLGALIAEHQYGSQQIVKWHKGNEPVVHKSIDFFNGEWLYQLNNTLFTDDMEYPQNPGEGWELVQAKLLAGGNVITLQKSTLASAPGYRLVISSLEGEEISSNFYTTHTHDFIALSRIADGFLLPLPNPEENSLRIKRLDLEGYFSPEEYNIDLPEGVLVDDMIDSRVTFSNPSESVLHACIWFRPEQGNTVFCHKYGYIDPLANDDPAVVPARGLVKCYPNPFNRQVSIEVESNKDISTRIGIYNIRGQKVRELPVQLTKGSETYEWDGNDGAGKPVAQGIYFIKVKALPDSKMQRILKIN
jgi:hypothetical protein